MRWLSFALLAGLAICVQTSVVPRLMVFGVYPDLMLVLVIHYTLHARRIDGLFAGWLLGLLVDLTSVEDLGMVAVVYGLMALAVYSIRDLMFTGHPLTHFFLTFVCCAVVQAALRGYFYAVFGLDSVVLDLLGMSLLCALYTGLCAIVIHRFLLRFSPTLGLRRPKGSEFSSLPRKGWARFV